ncbi:MAG: FixH family protein [Pseudomonadota bacterium]
MSSVIVRMLGTCIALACCHNVGSAAEPISSSAWWNQAEQIAALSLTRSQRGLMEQHLTDYIARNRTQRAVTEAAATDLYIALSMADGTAAEIATTRLSLLASDALSRQTAMVTAVLRELDPVQHNLLLTKFPQILPRFWKVTAANRMLSPQLKQAPIALEERPKVLRLARKQQSETGRYTMSIEPHSVAAIPLHQIHGWTITLEHVDGKPVTGAVLRFVATMPEHGHGMSTEAEVSPGAAPGQYIAEGVNFHMPGWWQVSVAILDDGHRDLAHFNLTVGEI